jgi:hypothetical protein
MCTALSFDLYCTTFKCPHNLFWEELNLDREKIQMTDKTLEIRNCCCRIIHPWTPEEISDAWGLTKEEIRRSEEEALKKLQRKVRINLEENNDIDHRKCPSYRNFKFEEIRKLKYGIYSLQSSCGG